MSGARKVIGGGLVAAAVIVVSVAASGVAVPFKGHGSNVLTGQDVVSPTEVVMTAMGTGQATHLGRYTRIEALHLNPETGAFTGTIVFVAANGHQLTCSVAGHFTSQSEAAGSYTIAGGTGRFADATGSATFTATLTSATTFTVAFEGHLIR